MTDEKYTFEQARVRLEEIVIQVRRKDVSLESSIELLEEGVRLANMCTELSDHTEWRTVVEEQEASESEGDSEQDSSVPDEPEANSTESVVEAGESDEAPTDSSKPESGSEEESDESFAE